MAKPKAEKKRPPPDPDPDNKTSTEEEKNEPELRVKDKDDKEKSDEEKNDESQVESEQKGEKEVEDTKVEKKEEVDVEFTAFEHLMLNVYGKVTKDSPIYKALVANGMDSCMHFKYDNEPQYIDALSYMDERGNRIQPLNGAIISLIKFHKFVRSLNTRNYRTESSFYAVTFEMWEEHYSRPVPDDVPVSSMHPGFVIPSPPASPTKSVHTSYAPYTPTKAQNFMKAKRNEAAFMVLKHQNQWLDWYDSTRRHADNQDCSEVLDPDYVPLTEEDEELFKLQKKYMLAVFDTTLKTAKSRQILNAHIEDKDAQAVFREVLEYYTDSTNSSLTAQDLLAKLMRVRMLTDGKGMSYEFYLLQFQSELRRYDSLVPHEERLSNAMKNSLTQNLIKGIPCLMNVRSSAGIMKIGTGTNLSHEKYMEALMVAALEHDDQFRATSKGGKLNVYTHDIFGDPIEDFEHGELLSGEDTYEAYLASGQTGYFPKLTREQWSKLSPEDRIVWDKLSDAGKSTIMHRVNSASKQPPAKRSEKYPGTARQANMSDATLGDVTLSQMLSALVHSRNESYTEDDDDDKTQAVEINQTKSNPFKNEKHSLHPGSLHNTLEKKTIQGPKTNTSGKKSVNFDQVSVNMAHVYSVSNRVISDTKLSLIDRGANGGVGGEDVRLVRTVPDRFVDIQGIDNHQMPRVPIATVAGVVKTQVRERIAVFHKYAYTGRGVTIHSSGQLEKYGQKVDDRSVKVGGTQRILTKDGYVLPLIVTRGLCRLDIRPYTDEEWDELPHIFLTDDKEWDPTVLDHKMDDDEWKGPPPPALEDTSDANLFDEFGEYRSYIDAHLHDSVIATAIARVVTNVLQSVPPFDPLEDLDRFDPVQDIVDVFAALTVADNEIVPSVPPENTPPSQVNNVTPGIPALTGESTPSDETTLISTDPPTHDVTPILDIRMKPVDVEKVRPMLAYLGFDVIKETFARTTQYAREYNSPVLQKLFKSPHPAMNVARRKEAIATDTIFSNTKAFGLGVKHAQLFVGVDSGVIDIYPLHSQTHFATVLTDVIRDRGAPTRVLSDQAKAVVVTSTRTMLNGRFKTSKWICDIVMDRSGAPDDLWFECLSHVADILNHTYNRALKDVPLRVLNGNTPDISPFIRFRFFEKVYYRVDAHSFPSQSREDVGYFVGVSKNVGNAMTFKILTMGSRRIIHRSAVRSAETETDPNRRVDPLVAPPRIIAPIDGEIGPPPARQLELVSRRELDGEHGSSRADVPIFHPDELIGRTFLYDPENPEGLKYRAKILGIAGDIAEAAAEFEQNRNRIQYRCSINDGQFEAMLTYGEVMEYINRDIANPTAWKFRKIVDNQGPLTDKNKEYAGSPYNVKVAWENGEVTWMPLDQFAKEAPVECAIYAKANDLLHANGWRRFRAMAKKKEKIFERLVKQAKLRSYNTAPRYKYGYEIPRNFLHAILLDERNGNTKWMDATALESGSLHEYSTFRDCGHKDKVRPLDGYKKIRVHFVYDVKHDGRHKARLVADGHLTDIPLDSVYAGVVTIKGIRVVVFVAELNQELYATDVGNAYLEAKTREKVYIIAGPEFGELKDHILVIVKALYGLRSSNYRWAERLADVLREMGFFPSKSEPDVWMRRCDDLYEYIAVYVDDLLIVSKQPMLIVEALKHKYGFKLKGTGPVFFHLGMNFVKDSTDTLSYSPTKYLERMFVNYERVFGQKPRNYQSPLEPNDHPELDTSEFLDDEKTKTYQSLIGALQWLVTIGRIDIFTAVMSMSSFRSEPRFGHMDRVKRIYGYLYKFRHSAIRVDVSEPDYSTLPAVVHDWDYSVYAGAEEMIPHDAPESLGKPVLTTTYVDANLYHDMLTGKSVTGILHMINNTPYEWYSKKQATVETATYGSEFSAARTAVEQITDLRLTLRYLGIPVRKTSYLFGDNKSVVDSSALPGSKLHKRHTMLSYHRVREAIASGMIEFHYIPGELNAADLLSKHWSYAKTWKFILRPLLFLVGGKPSDDEEDDKVEA
ncbi:hypothetical protein FisN_26Hu045 [Fistulifera solaris]|uniref:Reverse transcriptase Ty1/copia-type domain-containing protein n=1 Tax=Fistulifera solaris TaxID=1519565 RepID=A0A1Z5JY03_FISSO|nr:hypothetical protein FisN_26Hu045 [Fistulifera solaris]|eukprot:GAX18752.1 hypothetical protein FisN_26Hu045 [Fistulifera solaris]